MSASQTDQAEAPSAPETLDDLMKRRDPDRWLAARFAPPADRARLTALYAFNYEVARALEAASEPMIIAMRLAWWREVVEEVYQTPDRVRRHETATAMAEAFGDPTQPRPTQAELLALIDARTREAEREGPIPDMEALSAHVDATAGGLAEAALACVSSPNPPSPQERAMAAAVARAWGLAGLARAFGSLLQAGRAPVTARTLARLGAAPDELAGDSAKARAALTPLLETAEAALMDVRALGGVVSSALWPALGYGVLTRGYAARFKRADHDPLRGEAERSLLIRQIHLVTGALTGRVC